VLRHLDLPHPGPLEESPGDGLAQGRMLDLPAVAARLLERAGVAAVESAGICTSCNQDLFFSHRGSGGRTGRQAGLVRRIPG
jgi:copper oxidase (laccase) domain-containing protein